MNPQLQLLVRAELKSLLKAGFIKPVEIIDWVYLMVMMRKNSGKLRVCVDCKKLNANIYNNHFPLPFITLLLKEIGGHACYSFMNNFVEYNQISIAFENIHKTIFATPWGTFVWVIMPFGLCYVRPSLRD
jgi:hypothetical protein